jgi:hypothetical protein
MLVETTKQMFGLICCRAQVNRPQPYQRPFIALPSRDFFFFLKNENPCCQRGLLPQTATHASTHTLASLFSWPCPGGGMPPTATDLFYWL